MAEIASLQKTIEKALRGVEHRNPDGLLAGIWDSPISISVSTNDYLGAMDGIQDNERNRHRRSGGDRSFTHITNDSGEGYGDGYCDKIVSLRGRTEVQPHFVEKLGNKCLIWQINVRGFHLSEQPVVDNGNNQLEICGSLENVGQHHRLLERFTRIISLPEGLKAEDAKVFLSADGLLTVEIFYTDNDSNTSNYGPGNTYGDQQQQSGYGGAKRG